MKATTVMWIILPQKPSRTSKTKNHVSHLQRQMELWLEGDIQALLDEGRCIQKCFVNLPKSEAIARTFRNLMLHGKVLSALRYFSRNANGGVLKLEELVPETTQYVL